MLSVLAVAAFAMAVIATAATLGGNAVAGVDAENPGGQVLAVSTTGFAWRDGLRAGQTIIAVDDTLSARGWRIETVDAEGAHHASAARAWDEALDASWPLAAGAVLASILALVFVRAHRRWVFGAATIAFCLAAAPLQIQGNPALSTAAMAAAAAAPAAWFGTRLSNRWALAGWWLLTVAGLLAWGATRLAGVPAYEGLEALRGAGASYGATGLVLSGSVMWLMRGRQVTLVRPALAELVLVAVIVALGAVLVFAAQLPPLAVAVISVIALLALPRARRFAARRLEDVFLADVRQHVALEASEAERARLAHELHDVPLQHLTSVIRRLEIVPGARDEAVHLREVAEQLREAATNLRPPVLDDLGLGAGLEFLASRSSTATTSVRSIVADASGPFPDTRPPADVELAVFRIAQEAVANALQHAEAGNVTIEGAVGRDEIDVVIRDDGHGMATDRIRDASRRGRLGLASMRRRAEAVDADFDIDAAEGGTAVKVRWQR